MKQIFLDNGFKLVYDEDRNLPLSNGFFFTVKYPMLKSEELLKYFLYFGISAISLKLTRSFSENGIRVCTSLATPDDLVLLDKRLSAFYAYYKQLSELGKEIFI